MSKRIAWVLATSVVVGCGSNASRVSPATVPPPPPPRVTVMTQNLYLGANLKPLFQAPSNFASEAVKVLYHVYTSDFPARAVGIVNEIKAHHPDLVGLQEVPLWQTGKTCATLSPTNTGGIDYLTTLQAALDKQGVAYRVAAQSTEFSASASVANQCASFTEREVILARADLPSTVQLSNPQGHQFGEFTPPAGSPPGSKTELQVTIPVNGVPQTVPVHRGWTSIDVSISGKSFRFVDTQLEAWGDQIRDIQAQILVKEAAGTFAGPSIVVGDFNLKPPSSGVATLAGSNLTDAWPAAAQPGDVGNTAGQDDSLRNVPSRIDHRVDFVTYTADKIRPVPLSGIIVGNQISDMVPASPKNPIPGPLWPADHAGMIVALDILGS